MKKLIFLSLAVAALNTSAVLTYNSGTLNQAVPDANTNGWVNSIIINDQPLGSTIAPNSLSVTLNLSGGWNGDLYAYLVNSSGGFTVLLDRVGTPASTFGYGDTGFAVTLNDSGAYNIHNYQDQTYSLNGNGQLTGVWQPDGVGFGSFSTPNGTWSLFIADLSAGDVTTVQNWGLQMDIVAVPEMESWVAAALAGAFGAFWLNRAIWRGVKPPNGGSTTETR